VQGSEKLFETPDFKLNLPDLSQDTILLPNYDAIFSQAARSIVAGGGQLEAALVPVTQKQLDFNTNMEALTEQLNSSVGPLLAGFAGQFGDAFGSIVTGAASASDAMQALFGGILQSLGGFMSEFGQQLIAIGIGKLALDSLFTGPQGGVLAIAAGAGLVALAGVVSAVGKSAASNLGSITSSGGASSPTVSNYGQTSNQTTIKIVAEFMLRGKDLAAVGKQQTYRNQVGD
jgi:hypothetical protein